MRMKYFTPKITDLLKLMKRLLLALQGFIVGCAPGGYFLKLPYAHVLSQRKKVDNNTDVCNTIFGFYMEQVTRRISGPCI